MTKSTVVSIVMGTIVGAIPLYLSSARDPFDAGTSYLVWMGGFFVSGTLAYLLEPGPIGRKALICGLGLPIAAAIRCITGPVDCNLWPLTLIVSAIVAVPPASGGAFIGKLIAPLLRR
jgi:hypothetical protein